MAVAVLFASEVNFATADHVSANQDLPDAMASVSILRRTHSTAGIVITPALRVNYVKPGHASVEPD